MPNKVSQFWNELKRRNVVRVITVYAGAAFVILELVSNISEPFGLPDWTMKLVFVFLIIGLIIAIILSWIYDIHPEGGMVKTEPAYKVKTEDTPKSSNSWKIASYISFVVIVGLIVLNVIPRSGKKEILDKSIAVLPFHNDSPEQTEMYFIDGTMESILDNLSKIKDLRVVSRTSVEQYRDNPKPIPSVGEEMNVNYVVEGSGLRHGDNIRLTIQLIDAIHDQHIWSNTYDRKAEEIFELQSEIAQLVAKEIEAIITPQEKKLIENIPTTSLTAYDFFQKAQEARWKYQNERDERYLDQAEELYDEALKHDSTYAQAYTGLAWVYGNKHYWETIFEEDFLDSFLILSDIALTYDDQLSEAYTFKGLYYDAINDPDQALYEYDKAIRLNPNDWMAYNARGSLHIKVDYVKALSDGHKAASLNRGTQLPGLLFSLSGTLREAGFFNEARKYQVMAFKLSSDSARYYAGLSFIEFCAENFKGAIEYAQKSYLLDSSDVNLHRIILEYSMNMRDYEEAFIQAKRWLDGTESLSDSELFGIHRVGWAYWQKGFREEAEYYLRKQIEYSNRLNEIGRGISNSNRTYYDLAATYAFLGDTEQALTYWKAYREHIGVGSAWGLCLIRNDPLLDNIRDEPEFQQIVREIEANFQAEHERVRQWLEENDML